MTIARANADWALVTGGARRRIVLRRQFARHWDMIWHLRRHGMTGRTLRKIYGDGALIWSVGGGIDTKIGEI